MTSVLQTPPADDPSRQQKSFISWAIIALCIYGILVGVGLISGGFKEASGGGAGAAQILQVVDHPLIGLFAGILATSLVQSSSTVTSVIVGLVAGGMPVSVAIPIVMGANVGTTLTNSLVSLGHVTDREKFGRAFSAASIHDFFNLLAVLIFFPLELALGLLERLSAFLSGLFIAPFDGPLTFAKPLHFFTDPPYELIKAATEAMGPQGSGIVISLIGITVIIVSVLGLGRVAHRLMEGRARRILNASIGHGPAAAIVSGAAVTAIVQSSSTTTSLMVPLAGTGALSLRQIYPFTLGANIGTTITALLAALGAIGPLGALALQIAVAHLLFNVFAVLLIYSIPFLRNLPIHAAEALGSLATRRRRMAALYLIVSFFVLPGCITAAVFLF